MHALMAKRDTARKGHLGPYYSLSALPVAGNHVLGAEQSYACIFFMSYIYLLFNDMSYGLRSFVYLGYTSSLAGAVYSPTYS